MKKTREPFFWKIAVTDFTEKENIYVFFDTE